MRLALRLFIPLVFCAGLVAQGEIYRRGLADLPIRSDGISYHVYLPSIVLHGSPRLWATANDQYGGAYPEHTGILRWPNTSWWLNPHPIGVAVLMLPFFLMAHALTLWSNLPPDGFSLYYQIAATLGGLTYGTAGLAILSRVLQRHVPEGVVLATLTAITFGTNYFHYLTFDATFSHTFAFFLVAALLSITERWWTSPTSSRTVMLGLVVGALFLVRHSHLLLILVPALYRPSDLWARRTSIVVAGLVALLVALPQLAIYKAVTGVWIVSPYSLLPATMNFGSPEIAGVLFTLPKGLFFWSPVLLASVVGVFLLRGDARAFRWSSVVVFLLLTWLVGSWYDWQFGGSYGHRGFTDVLPLFAVPMAAAFDRLRQASLPMRTAGVIVVGAAVLLSTFQMVQYWNGLIPFQNTTWTDYVGIFLRWP
jgi:hypothetical protein